MTSISQYLFNILKNDYGVERFFGIPGDFALSFFKVAEDEGHKIINMAHEPGVGFAADAYARRHGLGVGCVTYCVGGLNTVNPVAGAYAEKSPVLIISGAPSRVDRIKNELIHHKVKTFDTQYRIYQEITCASTILNSSTTAATEIHRVIRTILDESRPGYIELPYDMVHEPIYMPSPDILNQAYHPYAQTTDAQTLQRFRDDLQSFINRATRPVIMADVELHRHGLSHYVVEIAEKYQIPVVSTLLSKSIFPEDNPLYLGVYGGALSVPEVREYVENSDCIMMLGAFKTDMMMGVYTADINPDKCIFVTTEKAKIGYYRYEEIQLHEALKAILTANITPKQLVKSLPTAFKRHEAKILPSADAPLSVENVFTIFEKMLPKDATVVADVGDACFGAFDINLSETKGFICNAYYLSMGFAMPATVGVMANQSENTKGRTFAIIGDGAFQMTCNELSTIAKFGLKPIILVFNNNGYGTQRFIVDGDFNNITQWQYHKLADVIGGGKGYKVSTITEFQETLTAAISDDTGYSLIELMIPSESASPALNNLGQALKNARTKS